MDDGAARPKSLKFKEPVIDVALSPAANLVASSLITGHVFVHRFSLDGNERLLRQKVHKKSCRSVCFSQDGSMLYSASKDRSWQAMDIETGMQKLNFDAAHDKPINLVRHVNEQTVATGDDAGVVRLWDVRSNKPTFAYSEHVDYVSDMTYNADRRHLLATSGDGCLSVYDVRKAKPYQVSDNQDDELLSIAIMRGGKKVVVGETDGVLGIFTYDQFGDISDRFPGHPQSIDTICKLTEDLCVTGSSDGLLRIVQLFPHKLVGVAGDHDSLPVEKVVLSYDQQWLASCSHDHTVHFWDIGYIFEDDDDDEDDDNNNSDDDDDDDDGAEDVQAAAIRISKEVGSGANSDVDIDGVSEISELQVHSEASDGESASDKGSLDDGGSSGGSEGEEEQDADVDVGGPANGSGSGNGNGNGGNDKADGNDDSGDGGWGSWGDSDDSGAEESGKKTRKAKKLEMKKAKRKAKAELINPSAKIQKRNQKSASFFADL
ncbi:WD domain repeat-containing protein 55 [Coemansia sp. RSA 2599]|nr:WD domain repeat-containing protein 55 [Coemansia sp. RSA 2598]KAJ1828187.1 WD domain repeat-containing protein 55 [Coemansia sp. RSA 2599]